MKHETLLSVCTNEIIPTVLFIMKIIPTIFVLFMMEMVQHLHRGVQSLKGSLFKLKNHSNAELIYRIILVGLFSSMLNIIEMVAF